MSQCNPSLVAPSAQARNRRNAEILRRRGIHAVPDGWNLLVHAGGASGGLVVIECRSPQSVWAGDHVLPRTNLVAVSDVATYRYYRVFGPLPEPVSHPEYVLHAEGSLVPVHPGFDEDGHPVDWRAFGDPALVDAETLVSSLKGLAETEVGR